MRPFVQAMRLFLKPNYLFQFQIRFRENDIRLLSMVSVTAHSPAPQGQSDKLLFDINTLFDLHSFQMLCGKCWHVAPWSRSPNTMLWWRAAPLMHIDRSSQMNKQHFYRYEQWTAMHDIPIEQTRWTWQCYSNEKNWTQEATIDMFTLKATISNVSIYDSHSTVTV